MNVLLYQHLTDQKTLEFKIIVAVCILNIVWYLFEFKNIHFAFFSLNILFDLKIRRGVERPRSKNKNRYK